MGEITPPANRPGEYMRHLEQKVTELEERLESTYLSGYRAGWNDALAAIKDYCNKEHRT